MIGAGPAGAASAYLLAQRGWRVLLLERSSWPREKVCGGCLSASAVACLKQIGLTSLLEQATPIHTSVVHTNHRSARVPAENVFAVRRDRFDAQLVEAFQAAGGTFVSGASASLCAEIPRSEFRSVFATLQGERIDLRARTVLACDGLGGSSVSDEPWATWTIAPDAYIGVGATVPSDAFPLPPHEIHMHIGEAGYVGAVRYADGEVHLAAALDPQRTRAAGGPAAVVTSILCSCGRAIDVNHLRFKGTPTLTRRREQLGGHRVLAVGDACGYVEPFTGEGIAWALRSAIEATSLLQQDWNEHMPQRWKAAHAAALRHKQSLCRAVRFVARRPLVANAMVELLRHAPSASRWLTRASEVKA